MTSVETERGPGPRRPAPWLELGLLAAAVAVALPRGAFLGGVLYKRDVHLVWHAQVEAFVRVFAQGGGRVWDPSLGFGRPLLADPSAQILYPLTWLNLLMRPWPYYTPSWSCTACWLPSACGLLPPARGSRLAASAFVATALWILSGPYLSGVDLWHHYAGASWLP